MNKCQFCGTAAHNAFYCSCGKILPACWDNLFIAFGLPIAFEIDLTSLRHNYYMNLEKLHPDKFHQGSEEEKQLAQEYSSFLNRSYNTLRQPWLRAEYMLQLLHPNHATEQNVDQNLLLEVMEWREEMDCADNRSLIDLQDKLKEKENHMLSRLKTALESGNYSEAELITTQFRFLKRSIDELKNLFDK